MIQVHLCVVYFFSGCGKLLGASWWEGTALWGAIANDAVPHARPAPASPAIPLVINALTLATLFWELAYAGPRLAAAHAPAGSRHGRARSTWGSASRWA